MQNWGGVQGTCIRPCASMQIWRKRAAVRQLWAIRCAGDLQQAGLVRGRPSTRLGTMLQRVAFQPPPSALEYGAGLPDMPLPGAPLSISPSVCTSRQFWVMYSTSEVLW